ncbi:MAG TPA: crossover junction endodeoxyribonuclease RuvC [Actinomycetota bacterium]
MFEGPVLGVDPGTAAVGLAVLEPGSMRPRLVWAGTVRTPAGLAVAGRLRLIHQAVRDVVAEHRPSVMAIERLMWGRNAPSGMDVARASGVIMLAASEAGIPVEEYAPLEVKMAVTGTGNAPKDAVRRSLVRVLGMDGIPIEPNAADAVAVAVCHIQQAGMRRLIGRASST